MIVGENTQGWQHRVETVFINYQDRGSVKSMKMAGQMLNVRGSFRLWINNE